MRENRHDMLRKKVNDIQSSDVRKPKNAQLSKHASYVYFGSL